MLKSKRFKTALLGILGATLSAASGEITWHVAIMTSLGFLAGYMGLVGVEDVVSAVKGKK